MINMLHIHPTKNCNRNCSFCSYRYSHTDEQLPVDYVCEVLREGKELGYTKVRFAGGGEPLSHKHAVTILCTAKFYGYDISLQTNGDYLSLFHKKICTDIRVSLGDGLPFKPKSYLTGYNYVITAQPDYDNLNCVIRWANARANANKQYVRIVTDDTDIHNTPTIDEIKQHIPLTDNITFHDGKDYHRGKKHCPSNHLMLGADGFWYPCCRTQYSKGKNLTDYDTTMRLSKQYESLSLVTNIEYNGRKCKRCYYKE